ncbi:hypothetical protein KC354_g6061 [Hortaea werneckii]|nr:hypothetical protein KC354_g6061 [Hortaea werneckii]
MGRLPPQAFVSIPVRTSYDTKRILKEQQAWFEFTERRSETPATPPPPPVYRPQRFGQISTRQSRPEVEHTDSLKCVPDSQAETTLEDSGSSTQADEHVLEHSPEQSQTTFQTSSMTVVDESQPYNDGSFSSSLHSRSSYAPSDVSSRTSLPPKRRRKLEPERSSIVSSSLPLTAATDPDRPRHLRERPMVPPNYQELSSQLLDSFFKSSQQVELDDMNYLLVMNERQSREVRARMYGVPEAVVSAWDMDDEDATSDSDESECGVFDDSQLHDVGSYPNRWSSRPSRARAMQSTSTRASNTVRQPSGPSQRDRDMRTLINAFAEGWLPGIKELLSTEFNNHNLPRQHLAQLSLHAYLMLISMEQAVFEGLLRGTLGRQYHADPSTRRALDRLNSRVQLTSQPGIYWQSILSPDGHAPTPDQTIEVLDTIERLYLQPVIETGSEIGLETVLAIDGVKLPHTSAHEARMGLRKYVFKTSQQGKRVMSRARLDRLQLFCRRLRRRIQCIPSKFRGQFRLQQHTIFLIYMPIHSPLFEIAATRLSQGTIFNAGGFTFYPAGRSNATVNRYSLAAYKEWKEWAWQHTNLQANHAAYMKHLKESHVDRSSIRAAHSTPAADEDSDDNEKQNKVRATAHLKGSHNERSSRTVAHSTPAADEDSDDNEKQFQVRATASADPPLPAIEQSDQRTDRVDMTKEDLQRLTVSLLDRLRDISASLDPSVTSA